MCSLPCLPAPFVCPLPASKPAAGQRWYYDTAASREYDVHMRVTKTQQSQLGTMTIGRLCLTLTAQIGNMLVWHGILLLVHDSVLVLGMYVDCNRCMRHTFLAFSCLKLTLSSSTC